MSKAKLSLNVTNPSEFHNLGIELWLDQSKFFDKDVAPGQHQIIHEFDEKEMDHEFRIILKNKLEEHTTIDDSDKIIKDAMISVDTVCLDEIDIDQLMWQYAEYTHDGNGAYETRTHKFYGNLGCNGTVSLKFSTPIYMWLLENM